MEKCEISACRRSRDRQVLDHLDTPWRRQENRHGVRGPFTPPDAPTACSRDCAGVRLDRSIAHPGALCNHERSLLGAEDCRRGNPCGPPSELGTGLHEPHMAKNLSEHLDERPAKGFRPVPHYFPSGDFVSYFFRNDRCYARQVDELLTVYLAFGSDELVGCKIKGVKHILRAAGDFE